MEIQLKGRHIQLDKVVEEDASLRAQFHVEEGAHIPIPLPECNECENLIDQCQYLEAMIFRKDVLIQSLIQKRNPEEARKMKSPKLGV